MENQILRHFNFAHLPKELQSVSKPFCDLAHRIDAEHKNNSEKSTVLRKLLEAKDAAVRSYLFTVDNGNHAD